MLTVATIPSPGSLLQTGDPFVVAGASTPGVGPADRVGRDLDPAGQVHVLVSGAQNLQNALLRRLQCPLGYLPQHPDYGSRVYSYLGTALDLPTVLSLRDEVGRTLLADPRVLGVETLTVDVDMDVVVVSATLDTVLGSVNFSGSVAQVGG